MSHERVALKAGIWYTISNFFSKAVVFLTMPLFSRLMDQEDIGLFSNYNSWVSVLVVIASLELFTSVTIAKFDYKDDLNDYIFSNLIFGSVFTLILLAVLLPFKAQVVSFFGFTDLQIGILLIYLLVYPATEMLQVKCRLEFRYKASVLISSISIIFPTVFSVIAVIFMKNNKLDGRILGYFLPLILLNIVIYAYFALKAKRFSFKPWKYALILSLPMVFHILSANILGASDQFIITKVCGAEQNALYSIAYSCGSIISVLWTSLNNAWSAWAYEQMASNNIDALKKASKPYILFFVIVAFFFILVAPEFLYIMGGRSYVSAKYVMPPIVTSFVFLFIYSLYVNIETFLKKNHFIAIGTMIAAISNIVLNLLLIPMFGYIAAAYTTLIGYMIMFFIHFLVVKKLKKNHWYDTKYNFKVLLIALGIMAISNVLYTHTVVRYVVILTFVLMGGGLIVVLYKNEIKKAWKTRSFKDFHFSITEKISNLQTHLKK
ncbi:MAG: hypothetical protein E7666_02135 [Ruminococcaceae bacterium]|nr:hypothetical protein [Oscillospiraceae bacterium]